MESVKERDGSGVGLLVEGGCVRVVDVFAVDILIYIYKPVDKNR